ALLLGGDQAIVAATFGKHLALSVDQPDPHAGRAPVDGGHRRCVAGWAHRKPPSTISICAVSMRDASEARNSTVPTMSSGCITCLMHCLATWAASACSVTQSSFCRSVITQPGAMALTRMPS